MAPGVLPEDVHRRLERAEHLRQIQEIVRTQARTLAGADGATFVLRDVDHCFYADEDAMSPLWKGQRFPLTNCISGWAMLHAETVVIPDISLDERIPIESYRPTFVKSLAMVPVGLEKPIAAIGAYWADLHEASAEEVAVLEALAEASSRAIERVGLFDSPALPRLSDGEQPGELDPLERMPASLEAAADHERIAMDLHDTVLQRLFGAGLMLQAITSDVNESDLEAPIVGAIEQIEKAIRDLRGVIFGLEYGQRRLGGLHGEVLAMAAEVSRSLGFKPDVVFHGCLDHVEGELRHEAVSALSEMLSNVSRHASASQVMIEVDGGTGLTIRVTDDGCGLPDVPKRGSGLSNLQDRAEMLGGTCVMSPGETGGTTVTWTVPRQPDRTDENLAPLG